MTAGSIHPLPRDRVVARRDARLPTAWIGGNGGPSPDVAGLSWLRRGSGEARPRDPRGTPVLVMIASDDGGALAELVASARAGSRIYALVQPSWGKDVLDPHLLSSPQVLIRRVPEVPVSGVHTPDGAMLWFGDVAGGRTPWTLTLDPAQAAAFRQVFLRMFWHEATEEAWTGGRQLSWRVARDRPFDVPDVPQAASVRLVAGNARLELDARDGFMHLAGGLPPDVAPRCLWYPAGGDHHDRLAHVVRQGAKVVWVERHLPDLVVAGGRGELLLPGSRNRVRLVLTQAQATDVTRVLTGAGSWRFGVDVPIADGDGEQIFWLRGEGAARGVEREQKIDLPDVLAETLRAVPEAQPMKWPDAQPLALSVRYGWKVVPPRLPAGTEEDPLVGRWRKLDEDWASGLGRVREALQSVEGERGRIGRAFSRLVGAVLGFERTHGGLLADVASLEKQRPSAAGPSGAPALLSRLADLEDQAKKLQRDQDDAERKARDDEDREKQEAAWRARVEAAKQDLPARRQALSDAEARRPAAVGALASVEEALKSADKEAKKDLKARRHKVSDELTLLDKEIARLRRDAADLEQRVAEPFSYRATSSQASRQAPRGGRFVPEATAARSTVVVPEDALPEVGTLRQHRGKRFLVIQTWEELEAGERAAARLSAKLVAPEDA